MAHRLVVIGGGPVGVAGAALAARRGAEVTLVSEGEIGGRATWDSLLPSKVLLAAAGLVRALSEAAHAGVNTAPPRVSLPAVMARIRSMSADSSARDGERLRQAGVRVVHGLGRFVGPGRLRVEREGEPPQEIPFDRALVATGSVPIFPPGLKPDGHRILAPRFASLMEEVPAEIVIIGGGVTGTEFAHAFHALGARVVIVTDQPTLLPRVDEDVSRELETRFREAGIDVRLSSPCQDATVTGDRVRVRMSGRATVEGSHAFVAVGRRPDLDRLGLDALGARVDRGVVAADEYGETSVPGVFVAGDASGPPFTVNRGIAQARVAIARAMGAAVEPFDPLPVIEAVYTEPEVARVGLIEREARAQGRRIRVVRVDYRDLLKARLLRETEGFAKLLVDAESGAVLGASAVGAHAADALLPIAAAIAGGLDAARFASMSPAHPTLGEITAEAAHQLA